MNQMTRKPADLKVFMGRWTDTVATVTPITARGRDAIKRKAGGGDLAPASVLVLKSAIDDFIADTGCTADYY